MKAVLELSKPRITQLVVLTAAGGYYMGSQGRFDVARFAWTLVGTALVAAGANALNQLRERAIDKQMDRTRDRPLPSGRVTPRTALLFAVVAAVAGIAVLAWRTNLLTAGLATLTLVSYSWLYTSLKPHTTFNTLVGAIPGALPVLGGWTAAGGGLTVGGLALFWILFLWQLPHFLALAWIYREDYRTAGLVMLSIDDPDGARTARMAFLYAVALLPVSLLPSVYGITGGVYFYSVLGLSLIYIAAAGGMLFGAQRMAWARRVFLVSITYLPLLLTLGVIDKVKT